MTPDGPVRIEMPSPMARFSEAAKIRAMRALPLVLLLGCASKTAEPPKPPDVGDPAPDFSLVGSDGKTHKLSELRGQRAVVVAWFPKAFTGGCTAECKSLRESGEEIRKYDVAYYAVSTDKPEDNKRFAEELGVDYPILSDPDGATAKAYGVLGKDGVHAKRWTFYVSPEGTVKEVDREVKPTSAGVDVAKHLEALGVAKKP
jgi:thioredoxin-dependent peroxiredoxin